MSCRRRSPTPCCSCAPTSPPQSPARNTSSTAVAPPPAAPSPRRCRTERRRSARLVLDRATVGAGRSNRDRLAGGDVVEGGREIVLGGLDVGETGRRGVVDRTRIGDPPAA